MPKVYSYPTRRRRRSLRPLAGLAGIVAVIAFVFVWWPSESDVTETGPDATGGEQAAQGDLPFSREVRPARPDEPIERGEKSRSRDNAPSADQVQRIKTSVEAGKRALENDDVLTAQVQMSAALRAGATGDQADELRAKLVQLANRTVFSAARVSGDPHSSTYVVKRGDNLRNVAKKFKITDDLIARVNNLKDKSKIREGARLKILHGPCHAVIYKSRHALDVYLDGILIRTYKVGLGKHDGTPTGTWRVKNKLINPTYFPPRGGKVIQADDPENPLGEHWIGLEGIEGEAKDQLRYGIHGTNDPESIGKDASLGCIRLHNPDVTELYSLLVVGHSKVFVEN